MSAGVTQADAVAGCAMAAARAVQTSRWLPWVCPLRWCPGLLYRGVTPPRTDPAGLHLRVPPLLFLWLPDIVLLVFFRAVNPLPDTHNQRPVWYFQSYTGHNFIINLLLFLSPKHTWK